MVATPTPPSSTKWEPKKGLVLPDLDWVRSPNFSNRLHGVPYLVVMHRPVGGFEGSLKTLTDPKAQVSAHVLTEGNGTGVDKATQLVPWDKKSWSCAAFNSQSYNIEADDDAWDGDDWSAFYEAAHIAAFICHMTGIPPMWSHDPLHQAGVIRHLDLGRAGGGHSDPTSNLTIWRNFIRQIEHDVLHTGWRQSWGRGDLQEVSGV